MEILQSKYHPVDYNDAQHRYSRGHRIYRSATQIVGKMHKEFDVHLESIRMAEKYGHTPEYWKQKWDIERETSCIRGTALHNIKEEFLYGRGFDRINNRDFPVQNRNLLPTIIDYTELPDGIYPELLLWRHDWGIAGRADKPILETLGSDQYMHIDDYKTNKKIGYSGWMDPEGERKMFAPIDHLPDCEFTHYSLQLSLYQYMGEYLGFKPGFRRIIHFGHHIEGLGTPKPKDIPVPYLRDEVIAIMNHLTQEKWLR